MSKKQIVVLGGGGFSMEETPVLDDYILSLTGKVNPSICFVPTASGDNENYVVRFYRRFNGSTCRPTHLDLFRRDDRDLVEFAKSQDVIYVGGGNTANMLVIWRLHEFDNALRLALGAGDDFGRLECRVHLLVRGWSDRLLRPESRPAGLLGISSGEQLPTLRRRNGPPTCLPSTSSQWNVGRDCSGRWCSVALC